MERNKPLKVTEIDLTNFIGSELIDIKRENISTQPGIYLLYRKEHISQRYSNKDNTGLINIGSSSNLQQRIVNLKNGILGNNPQTHSINERLGFYFRDSQDISNYFVKYQFLHSIKDSKSKEKLLIQTYFKKYLDLPILNSNR